MRLKELLQIIKNEDRLVQIIKAKSVKDEHTPFYHYQYDDNTIIMSKYDIYSWLERGGSERYIVLIPDQQVFDIGRVQKNRNIRGIVVTTMEDLEKQMVDPQLSSWLEWLDKEVRKEVFE